jgi:hypothetical protein
MLIDVYTESSSIKIRYGGGTAADEDQEESLQDGALSGKIMMMME